MRLLLLILMLMLLEVSEHFLLFSLRRCEQRMTCLQFSLGLDDLRDWTNNVQPHIPIYVAKRDFEVRH